MSCFFLTHSVHHTDAAFDYTSHVPCMVTTAKMDEPIEMPFGADSWGVGPTHWSHRANTIERAVRSGGVALCQITLTTC